MWKYPDNSQVVERSILFVSEASEKNGSGKEYIYDFI